MTDTTVEPKELTVPKKGVVPPQFRGHLFTKATAKPPAAAKGAKATTSKPAKRKAK